MSAIGGNGGYGGNSHRETVSAENGGYGGNGITQRNGLGKNGGYGGNGITQRNGATETNQPYK